MTNLLGNETERAQTFHGSVTPPFVIPTGAKRSGGICIATIPIATLNGSATLNFVIPTGAYPDFLPR